MRFRLTTLALGLVLLAGCQTTPNSPEENEPIDSAPSSESQPSESESDDNEPMGDYGCQ
ncbi:MAG: hypothetical protein WD360_07365 [Nitriliruptoraceae bacterium]